MWQQAQPGQTSSTSRFLTVAEAVAAAGQVRDGRSALTTRSLTVAPAEAAMKQDRMWPADPDVPCWAQEQLAPKGHTAFRAAFRLKTMAPDRATVSEHI